MFYNEGFQWFIVNQNLRFFNDILGPNNVFGDDHGEFLNVIAQKMKYIKVKPLTQPLSKDYFK